MACDAWVKHGGLRHAEGGGGVRTRTCLSIEERGAAAANERRWRLAGGGGGGGLRAREERIEAGERRLVVAVEEKIKAGSEALRGGWVGGGWEEANGSCDRDLRSGLAIGSCDRDVWDETG